MERATRRRNTKQRMVILEELRKVKTHPNAETLYEAVKKRLPSISFATVYRNLDAMSREGEILELHTEKQHNRYDGDISDHYHFFCLSCRNIFDIFEPAIVGIDRAVTEKTGFDVLFHRVDFYGYCTDCKKSPRE
jgi:Fur family transcriptional regulator, peroxide stress response regulator